MLIDDSLEYRVLPVPFHILTLWGVWCPGKANPRFKLVYAVYTCLLIFLEIMLSIESFVYLVIVIVTHRFEMDTFFVSVALINGTYKAISMYKYRGRIENLLRKGFDPRWQVPRDDEEKLILEDYLAETWRAHWTYVISFIAGVSAKLLTPMLKADAGLMLPTGVWLPYSIEKPFLFWLTYVQQIFVGAAIAAMHLSADTMMSGFFHQSRTQMKLLAHRLRNFRQRRQYIIESSRYTAEKTQVEVALMKQYISDHLFIYRYARRLNVDLAGWLLALLAVAVPNVCANVYLLCCTEIGVDEDCVAVLGFLLISLFQIYLPCWYGNEVILNSIAITDAIYEMDWFDLAASTKKALMFIMLRSTHPVSMTAAEFIPLDLRTFLSIMKTSYSVLSVLRQKN